MDILRGGLDEYALGILPQTQTLWIIFFAAALMFAGVSWMFVYHWREFGLDVHKSRLAVNLYFWVSAALFAGMLVALLEYFYAS